jgi:hypothetical protein
MLEIWYYGISPRSDRKHIIKKAKQISTIAEDIGYTVLRS